MAKSRKKKRASGGQSTGGQSGARRTAAAAAPAASAKPARETSRPPGATAPRRDADAVGAVEPMSAARRVAWWSLLAMVFLVPIAMSNFTALGISLPLTYDSFDIVKMSLQRILGLVALGAWAWDLLRRGGKVRHTPVDWLILALLAWVALSTVTSLHPATAVFGKPRRYEGLLSFINYALIYFLVLQFADRTARVLKLAQALFWSSVVVSAYGLLQYAGRDPVDWGTLPFEVNRAFSTYGNPDLLGAFLIFSVTIALALALFERRLGWRLVYWIGFGLNGMALIVAFTRGAWIGGAVALVVLGVVAWRQRAHLARIDLVPAGVFVAAGIAVVVRSLSSANEVMNFGKRLASIFQFNSGSGQTRAEIWQAAGSAIKERPLLGWGADTFRLVFPKFKPVEYVRDAGGLSVADNAHDYPLQLATGIGVPGMLMFYGVVVWAGVRSFSTVFRRDDDAGRLLVGAFWAAALGYLVQLLFGVSVTGVTFLLWIALAVALAPTARLVEVRAPRWGVVAGAAVLAVCVVGIGYQGVVLAADNAYMKAQASSSAEQRIKDAKRAVRLFPYSQTYRWGLGVAYMDELKLLLQEGSKAQQAGEDTAPYYEASKQAFVNAEAAFREAIAFVPDEYDDYVSLAELYTIAGQVFDKSYYQQALDVVAQGLKVEPLGTTIRVQMAKALWDQGKKAEAEKVLRYCLEIDPMGGQAALQLATFLYDQGKTAEALQILLDVNARAPGQAGVAEAISQLEAKQQQ